MHRNIIVSRTWIIILSSFLLVLVELIRIPTLLLHIVHPRTWHFFLNSKPTPAARSNFERRATGFYDGVTLLICTWTWILRVEIRIPWLFANYKLGTSKR
jgi:hypothetical protein